MSTMRPSWPRQRRTRWRNSGVATAAAMLAATSAGASLLFAGLQTGPNRKLFGGLLGFQDVGPSLRGAACSLAATDKDAEILAEIQSMRAREIKQELQAAGIPAADLFEKGDLVERLFRWRTEPRDSCGPAASAGPAEESGEEGEALESAAASVTDASDPSSSSSESQRNSILEKCRAMRVFELRTQLGTRGISWADALEKEELVQRLAEVLTREAAFSKSGRMQPGVVAQLTGAQLAEELEDASTPLLLDVFATWCGPCKMMAPHLEAAARSLGQKVRVAKLDSDLEPAMASRLRANALPTVILFDRTGKEVARQEGAMMEAQLLKMVSAAGV
ncbi:unnamed protein product [Polarella glacialis]|uniref:Thioredoxin domain-containing protein n=1 Tax=Polarella glacialis TaxID=89957 RepID=A0A813IN03_POLGL|nr:unnamed protein product [Polarella glacialis]CAE8652684.1 unnamed protein product [Polarella glacialis]